METSPMVVVAGATGRTGRLVVEELLKRDYRVRALVRPTANTSWLKQKGAEVVEADLTSTDSLEKAMEGADYAISAIGSKKPFNNEENNKVDNLGNQNIARTAMAKGLKHIVVISSIGAGNSRNALGLLSRLLLGRVLRMKEKAEAFIQTCGISYTIIRPGGLSDKELSGEVAFGEGGKITGSISRKSVARVCVDALTTESMKNKTLEAVDASTVKEKYRPFLVELS